MGANASQPPGKLRNDLLSRRYLSVSRGLRRLPLRVWLLLLAGALILGYGGSWAYDRFWRSDEEKIRRVLEEIAQAARERSPGGIVAHLSDDFADPQGYNKDEVFKGLVHLLMSQYRRVSVELSPRPAPVELGAQRQTGVARVNVRIEVKRAQEGEWEELRLPYSREAFRIHFKRTEKGWQVCGFDIEG